MWIGGSATVVPASDRFDWFVDVVAGALAPVSLTTADAPEFHAEGAALDLEGIQLSRFSYSPIQARRTPALIRRMDPEQYQLGLVTRGSMWLSQSGGESGLFSGDMVLWDTSRPFESGSDRSAPVVEAFVLQIPKERIPLRSQQLDRLLGRRIPANAGLGAILARFLVTLAGDGPDCRPQELGGLGSMAVELAGSCLAQQLGAVRKDPAELRAHVLLRRINDFIEHNLGDPDLTPQVIADHHHISLRSLYVLFEGQHEGVAASIRRRRLERCRTDLACPELSQVSLQTIAIRWGFSSATGFSRTFRETYGATPSEYRRQALGTRP
ncbi:helix-turn-helix domain-containing protein [Streptomyces sp. NPDC006739]|uniref:AraC-like ligand-binding domain-containing protein n=1 Tax=Streptomyces sp. NPDC006739 TaxID=3364763 RepID=UPI00369A579A